MAVFTDRSPWSLVCWKEGSLANVEAATFQHHASKLVASLRKTYFTPFQKDTKGDLFDAFPAIGQFVLVRPASTRSTRRFM